MAHTMLLISLFLVTCLTVLVMADDTRESCLNRHNHYRRKHSRKDLQYSETIERYARERANKIARTDELAHPNENDYGENLFQAVGSSPISCKEAIDNWYAEYKYHDPNGPDVQSGTGHYTQIIWKQTQYVGCATATSQHNQKRWYVVCNYWPKGNIVNPANS